MIQQRDIMSGLAKGLAIIETFSAERPRQSISQAAAASGLDRATARRCLLTLAHHGYADYDGKFFTLTPQVLRLGTACLATMPLPQVVQPFLDRLSDELGESSSVSILDGPEIVYVARAAERKVMSIALMPGSRLPAFCTSMGRVLLAALPDAEVEKILAATPLTARTGRTITDPKALHAELARVREDGYSVIDQEVEMGLCSIAVPLHNNQGQVIAAMNLGVPALHDAGSLAEKFLRPMRAVQRELSSLLR
ncbi:IclR family transcriptional regulator domain-containing protein [Hoeflea prorocentri]|uniref:Helix-turn-helix domain-containing protein n=1 Tax=Hoeflea prorocentri TaxID=1922333 RepID=A0A9X3UFA3_9HYPH|nr:IclR family transcriptional regulator C-terminal domain-containing protein [Hoeflea prorocentri]MCY6380207.1 helix-turn-helix domain-containing protein [Hoeflea prorocentri]MDA5398007.1 helix-turn-helix domain-containing protein [Hoeflea prorocentri]